MCTVRVELKKSWAPDKPGHGSGFLTDLLHFVPVGLSPVFDGLLLLLGGAQLPSQPLQLLLQ